MLPIRTIYRAGKGIVSAYFHPETHRSCDRNHSTIIIARRCPVSWIPCCTLTDVKTNGNGPDVVKAYYKAGHEQYEGHSQQRNGSAEAVTRLGRLAPPPHGGHRRRQALSIGALHSGIFARNYNSECSDSITLCVQNSQCPEKLVNTVIDARRM